MRKRIHGAALLLAALSGITHLYAQNTSPYWSLAGNSNATSGSKLGTTNSQSLRFIAGNVQRMMIGYSSGNVAIGTTSLTHKLTVGGNGRFTKGVLIDDGGLKVTNTNGIGAVIDASACCIGADVKGYLYGLNASAAYMAIDATGGNFGVMGTGGEAGVYGQGSGLNGSGVQGFAYYDGDYGVYGYASNAIGVYGTTGNTSSWAGYFSGDVYSSGTYFGSDRALKQNITELASALAIIAKLQPKAYTFRQDGKYKLMNLPAGQHYGLIAQDVEQVLPDLVKSSAFKAHVPTPPAKAASGATAKPAAQKAPETVAFKSLNYNELIPIIIKGMQEQQQQIQEQGQRIQTQQQQIEDLKNLVSKLTQERGGNKLAGTVSHATPNPATASTRISYSLPQGSRRAQLVLTDAGGKTVKALSLNDSGYVNLNTTGLSSGIYNYSLVVDGKWIESKKLEVLRNN